MRFQVGTTIAIIAAFGVVMGGCGSSSGSYTPKPKKKDPELAKIDPNDGESLFPAKVGNSWTYTVENTQNIGGRPSVTEQELIMRVVSVSDQGDGKQIILETVLNEDIKQRQAWVVNSKGIYQVWVGKQTSRYSPMQPSIMFPLEPGANFSWKGTGPTPLGVQGRSSVKGKLLAPQLVDTEMGPVTAIGVETNGTFTTSDSKGAVRTAMYFAKDIGLVRFSQETAFDVKGTQGQGLQTIRLKNHVLK